MNISIREAFLATKQQKDWAEPASRWIRIDDGKGNWAPEFMKMRNVAKKHDRQKFKLYHQVASMGSGRYRIKTLLQQPAEFGPAQSYKNWWNPATDEIIGTTDEIDEKAIQDYIDANPGDIYEEDIKLS